MPCTKFYDFHAAIFLKTHFALNFVKLEISEGKIFNNACRL